MNTKISLKQTVASDLNLKDSLEEIQAFLLGERNILSVRAERVLNDAQECKGLFLQYKFTSKVVKVLDSRGIKRSQAYRMINSMNTLFGNLEEVNRDMLRSIAAEMIKEDRELAKAKGDMKALTACTMNFIKLYQLDKKEEELPKLEDFALKQIIAAVLPEQVGLMAVNEDDILKKVANFIPKEKLREIIDIDYTEEKND